ncbi:DUF6894 family protein [Bradyrhizobium lablabi]|uniref:DUF6894 family protein n=1 Tax=Bradyrhizobium lablabi TaxID=722472 RepID=UPI003908BA23
MARYFFDIRDRQGFYPDEQGLELATRRDAVIEASQTLASLARDTARTSERINVTVEVRSETAPVFHASLIVQDTTSPSP